MQELTDKRAVRRGNPSAEGSMRSLGVLNSLHFQKSTRGCHNRVHCKETSFLCVLIVIGIDIGHISDGISTLPVPKGNALQEHMYGHCCLI